MAEVTLHPMWVFKLNQREALLVLKGLRGALTRKEDIEEAERLCDALTHTRAKESAEFHQRLQHHADNIAGEPQ